MALHENLKDPHFLRMWEKFNESSRCHRAGAHLEPEPDCAVVVESAPFEAGGEFAARGSGWRVRRSSVDAGPIR